MKIISAVSLFLLSSPPVTASEPLGEKGFHELTKGRTYTFSLNGEFYGAETYLSGNRVIWQRQSGECLPGHWYAQGKHICFLYENQPDPVCWEVYAEENGLRVVSTSGTATELEELSRDAAPLACHQEYLGS
ncbi:hypothetical protein [Thalassobius sp. I31.1]|uniref:hypothetical protein n=1 Tax=Thalassobius sp. I31.1 TaxID=2109912 RepID=UPI000D1A6A00|nr:hypothetical protein [Thalassobius sp. I31.1]